MGTKFWIVFLAVLFAAALAALPGLTATLFSQSAQFNVTEGSIFLNYTNSYSQNITIGNNQSYVLGLNITNNSAKTYIIANYSQPDKRVICTNADTGSLLIFVNNSTGAYNNVYINSGSYENVSLYIASNTLTNCNPGRYYGNLTITNSTNSNDNTSVYITVDIPISTNILNKTTGIGSLTAEMQGNATYYHKYYFNTSGIENSTSIRFNISSSLLDMFLFDQSGTYLAKSISGIGNLRYSYLTPNSMYELRIYGNITNVSPTAYTYYILYSTLNATDASNNDLQVREMDFGRLNVSGYSIQNITLKNEGNITYANVVENKEIYNVKRWVNNVSMDRQLLVPSFATKIKVAVNWTNTSQNYSLYLTSPSKTLIGYSNGKFINANFTGAEMEEFVETNSITAGYWNVSVRNNTLAVMDNYTLTAYIWYPVSEWIVTNYSTMTFNRTGNNNYTSNVNITFTIPNNTINGDFEGFVNYTSSYGSVLQIPLKATANTSSFVINQTLNSSIVTIDENIGFNTTRVMNITMNNTGIYPLSFVVANSSNALWNGVRYINFTYQIPTSPLIEGSNHMINITLNITTITTANLQGIYEGYIYFNSTEARPYQGFNLTLRVNLTNNLAFSGFTIRTCNADVWINETWLSENITSVFKIYYVNDSSTEIKDMNTSNLTSAWLSNANTSYRIPTAGTLVISNGTTGGLYCSSGCPGTFNGYYFVNTTIPANIPGGLYEIHLLANYTRADGYVFSGEGIGKYLYVNQTGLNMTLNTSPSSTNNNTDYWVNVTIKNYGYFPSTGAKITLNGWSSLAIQSTGTTNCTTPISSVGAADVNLINLGHGDICYVSWLVKTGASAGTGTTTINGTAGVWFGNLSFSTTISVPTATPPTTPGTTPSPAPNTTANTPTSNLTITAFPAEIKIAQNASAAASVSVNNSGTANLTGVKVYVDGINESWYAQPAAQDIAAGVVKTYSITFNIPADAPPLSYPIKYVANNSAATKSASAALLVLPNNRTAALIAANFSNYTQRYGRLELLLNQTKARGANVTEAEALMNQTKTLLDNADAFIKAGDYFSAYQLISQIDGLLSAAEAKIAESKQNLDSQAGSMWMWAAVIAVIIGVAGFVAYLALPPNHGFAQETGYKYAHPEARGKTKLFILKKKANELLEKIKAMLKKKQQPKPYAYKKSQSPPPFVYKGPPIED